MRFIRYKAGFKYQLAQGAMYASEIQIFEGINTKYFNMTLDGLIQVNAGYAWDGPSGPSLDTKNFMRGSLFHDIGYQMLREGLLPHGQGYRTKFDELLRHLCIADGMSKFRAWYVYESVNRFAKKAAAEENKKEVLIAP